MLENIWSELTYNQKKEIGKYALVFTGGVLAGVLINKFLESSMEEINKRKMEYESSTKNQIDIRDLEEDIVVDEDTVEDVIEK